MDESEHGIDSDSEPNEDPYEEFSIFNEETQKVK